MRWPWSKPQPLPIPPYRPSAPVQVRPQRRPCDSSIVVEEIDTSAMTQTGVHRAWKRLTGEGE